MRKGIHPFKKKIQLITTIGSSKNVYSILPIKKLKLEIDNFSNQSQFKKVQLKNENN